MDPKEFRAWTALAALLFVPPILTTLLYLYDPEGFLNAVVLRSIATQDAVDERAAAVWWAFVQGGFFSVLAGIVVALLWVVVAQRSRPVDDAGARSGRSKWWLMMLLALVAGLAVGYWVVDRSPTVAPEDPSIFAHISAVVPAILAILGAYWVATGLLVRPALRPSVPLAVKAYRS